MEDIKISKERILEAASKCSTAKATLEVLFPEVFKDDKYLDLKNVPTRFLPVPFDDCIQIRTQEEYACKGFWLDSDTYNWKIIEDSFDCLVLLPTKK